MRYDASTMTGRASDDERTATAAGPHEEALAPGNVLAFWPGQVAAFALPAGGEVTVGRGQSCELLVDHASVSRRHATLHVAADGLWIEDLGSAHGTYLNGERTTASTWPIGGRVHLSGAVDAENRDATISRVAYVAGGSGVPKPPPPGVSTDTT